MNAAPPEYSWIGFLVDVGMVFLPISGFIAQYREIEKSKSSEGFSNKVSFILLACNILRVFFWFGKQFEVALFFQSLVMIAFQFLLLRLICRYPPSSCRGKRLEDSISIEAFWCWEDFGSYATVSALFVGIMAFIHTIMGSSPFYVETLGFFALTIESTLGFPQAYRNWANRSTKGLSYILILTWVLGDSFKTTYFIANGSPFQFLLCGVIQLVVDFIIMGQIYMYNGAAQKHADVD